METREGKLSRLEKSARRIRRNIFHLTLKAEANGAHIGGALSSADIFAALYGEVLNISPETRMMKDRDRFILSKGHTAIGLYAALFEYGFLPWEEFEDFLGNDGLFPAHCVELPEKGIELSSGSLGMGLSFGIGCALAGKKSSRDYRVFVLMGNGECDEGSVWEAAIFGVQHGLDNLIAIIDNNGMQLDGDSKLITNLEHMDHIFSAIGWNSFRVDGHDMQQLLDMFERIPRNGKPTVIVADTLKGKGCSFMEGNMQYHHASITQEQYDTAMEELKDD